MHSSLAWFVQARILYAGVGGPMPERVRRGVAIFTG